MSDSTPSIAVVPRSHKAPELPGYRVPPVLPAARAALAELRQSVRTQVVPANSQIIATLKIIIGQEAERILSYSERFKGSRSTMLSPDMRRWVLSALEVLNNEAESQAATDALRGMDTGDLQDAVKALLLATRGAGRKAAANAIGSPDQKS